MAVQKQWSALVSETSKMLKVSGKNLQALLYRGLAYFYLDDIGMLTWSREFICSTTCHVFSLSLSLPAATSKKHCQEGIKFDPEHSELKKAYRKVKNFEKRSNSAKEALAKGNWKDAVEDFDLALGKVLYCEISESSR